MEKKNNCTPNYHKDKVIQVIISAKGILAITQRYSSPKLYVQTRRSAAYI